MPQTESWPNCTRHDIFDGKAVQSEALKNFHWVAGIGCWLRGSAFCELVEKSTGVVLFQRYHYNRSRAGKIFFSLLYYDQLRVQMLVHLVETLSFFTLFIVMITSNR